MGRLGHLQALCIILKPRERCDAPVDQCARAFKLRTRKGPALFGLYQIRGRHVAGRFGFAQRCLGLAARPLVEKGRGSGPHDGNNGFAGHNRIANIDRRTQRRDRAL